MISVPSLRLQLSGNKLLGFFILLILLSGIYTQADAQDTVKVKRSPVIEKIDGKKYYIHEIQRGQTVYSIAQAYNVTPKQIYQYNPDAKEVIKPSQMLRIPVALVEKDEELQRETTPAPESEKEGEKSEENAASDEQKVIIHTVREKETLYSLAREYNVEVSEIKALNPQEVDILRKGQKIKIPASGRVNGEPQPASERPLIGSETSRAGEKDSVILYKVKKGETLYRIAVNHDISVDDIIRLNPEVAEGLKAGTTIRLPKKAQKTEISGAFKQQGKKQDGKYLTHKVLKGETLYSLSVKYSISIAEIKKHNPQLKDGLKAGQVLNIPVSQKDDESSVTLPGKKMQDSLMFVKREDTVITQCDSVNIKRSYKVAVFMPLFLTDLNSIKVNDFEAEGWPEKRFNAFSYIHYYEGLRMALDSMEQLGLHADVYVYDTRGKLDVVKKQIQKPEFESFDLIFAPLKDELIPPVVEKAKKHAINVISPVSYDMGQVKGNSHLIKVFPPVNYQILKITDFVSTEFKKANKVFVYSSGDKQTGLINKIQELVAEKCGIHDSIYPWKTVDYDKTGFSAIKDGLTKEKANLIFFTNKGEANINRIITRLNGLREDYAITILGSNSWEDYKSIESQYLGNLNYISFSDFLIEYDDVRVKKFVRDYIKRYETWPHKMAFKGFDIGFYFLKALHNYGINFQYCMKHMDVFTMHTKFEFRQWDSNAWQNSFLNIYQHQNFKRINLIREFQLPASEKFQAKKEESKEE